MKTFNKHVMWRRDKNWIFICDCKRLMDFKLPIKDKQFITRLGKGLDEKDISRENKLLISDFKKMKMLSNLTIRQIQKKEFKDAMKILDDELGEKRVRNTRFLYNKFKEFPKFFIGIFLDSKIIGVVCGFPRDDYLLMSELAVDSRFHNRGYGEKLVREFEKKANKFTKIHAGAEDNSIGFYKQVGYKPFLLIQILKKDYKSKDYSSFEARKISEAEEYIIIEASAKEVNKNVLEEYRKTHPLAHFQFIFVKELNKASQKP